MPADDDVIDQARARFLRLIGQAHAGLVVDATVVIRSRRGHVEIEPEAAPDSDAMAFMDSFLVEYADAMEKLAKR
jgi:hypothetical protein